MEMEKTGPIDVIEKSRFQYFYDRFFMSRIGVRTLIYQHSKRIACLFDLGGMLDAFSATLRQ